MHLEPEAVVDQDQAWTRAVLQGRQTILENDQDGQDAVGALDAVLMLVTWATWNHDHQEVQVLVFDLHEQPWGDHEQEAGYAWLEHWVRSLIGLVGLVGVQGLNPEQLRSCLNCS